MSNVCVSGVEVIQFPQDEVIIASPSDLYTQVLAPQTKWHRPRVYLPGPITSGWAINIPEIRQEGIGQVIKENAVFGVTFLRILLQKNLPLSLPKTQITDLKQAQLVIPHAIGQCAHPHQVDESNSAATPPESWKETDYYTIWLGWMLGVPSELIKCFSQEFLTGVLLTTLNDHHVDRSQRITEVAKVYQNTHEFFRAHRTDLNPISAAVTLPNPNPNTPTQSLGTGLERQVAQKLDIPLLQFMIHAEWAIDDPDFQPLWLTSVGRWFVKELQKLPPVPNQDRQPVSIRSSDSN